MRHFHLQRNPYYENSLNVDKVWSLIPREEYTKQKERKDGKVLTIDITALGYTKVLGKGRLPRVPMIVRAKAFSKNAERKIKQVGGVCELCA